MSNPFANLNYREKELSRYRYTGNEIELVVFPWVEGAHSFGQLPYSPPSQPFLTREVITLFERRGRDTGSKRTWNPWQHYKMELTIPKLSSVLHPTDDYVLAAYPGYPYNIGVHKDPWFGWKGPFGSEFLHGSALYYDSTAVNHWVPSPLQLESLLQAGLNATMPGVKQELSAINSVIELKDYRSHVKKATSVASNLRRRGLHNVWTAATSGWTLRRLLKGAASVYLETQFNILPLLSDIRGLKTALANHERAINGLISRSAKAQHRHWSTALHESSDEVKEFGPYGLTRPEVEPRVYGSCYTYQYSYPQPCKFHFEIEYNFHYTQYDLEHARVNALLDKLGAGGISPQVLWNALPWSFVVDWVFGVNRYLSQFTIKAMEPVINIRRALWSVKRERRIILQKTVGQNDGSMPFTKQGSAGAITETSYRRQPWMPEYSSLQVSGLNLKEFTLGAALVIANRRSPSHNYKP